jgi:hypothetical protein
MSAVIEFPTKNARDWASFQRAIIPILRKGNVSEEAEKELMLRMKPFIDLLQMQFEFSCAGGIPEAINKELDRYALAIHSHSSKLFIERLNRELEILKISGLV